MTDAVVAIALACAFGALVTIHVATAWGLAGRRPRWRGLVALVVPPLAPIFAISAGLRARAAAWVAALLAYATLLALASR